ncbi:hypothetical protein BJ912DRAFT_243100 [Pholiota molesta]|nr:hypothetical protein BJ912DRAFT_243100 [Pholiota molesta]
MRDRPMQVKFLIPSTMATEPEAIPAGLRAQLLPSPSLSVSALLRYPLPAQFPNAQTSFNGNYLLTAADFGSAAQPDCTDVVNTIEALPIPPAGLLSDILASTEHLTWASVRYAHLATGNIVNKATFPPWIITYWAEVAHLQHAIKRPWLSAEIFLRRAQRTWKTPETRRLCDAADVAFLQLPWGGKTVAFGADDEEIHYLAHYLSHQWFHCTHIHQQLELLRLDLKHAGIFDCELLSPYTFDILHQMYRAHKSTPYGKDGTRRDVWGLGEELASRHRTVVAGVANVNGNHWVALLVDTANLTIKYGDSLKGAATGEAKGVIDAVAWWIESHISAVFKREALPITHQADGFSCGVLSIDAIRHAVLPGSNQVRRLFNLHQQQQ